MTSLFNSEPDPTADETIRPAARVGPAEPADEPEEQMLFSSVRRSASSAGGSSADRDGGSSGAAPDKEITLGTMTVLGIFFALAVLCAGFFAFGYSTGSKHTSTSGAGAPIMDASGTPGCKPAPGSLAGAATPPVSSVPAANVPYTQPALKPAAAAEPSPMAETAAPLPAPAAAVPERAAARTVAAPLPVTAPVAAPGAAGEQSTMVQVAALSHQGDAELVASTLKGRGYNVAIHTSPTDKLLHVQLGPYASRKEADAMRQKLLNDGFNAILK